LYIGEKISQKKELEERVEHLNHDIAAKEVIKSELEKNCDLILEQSKKAEEEMKSYFYSKQELVRHGISIVDDIPKFAITVRCIAEYGYDPQRVIQDFIDGQYHQDKSRALKIACDEKAEGSKSGNL
jgi:hypothetical protein